MTIRMLALALAVVALAACKNDAEVRRDRTSATDPAGHVPPPPDPLHPAGRVEPAAVKLTPIDVRHLGATGTPGADEAARERCRAILARAGQDPSPAVEVAWCAALTDAQRACLERATDLDAARAGCLVDPGGARDDRGEVQ